MSIIVRGSMITLPSGLVGRVSSKKKNGWLRVGVNTPDGRKVISVRNCGFVKAVVEEAVVEDAKVDKDGKPKAKCGPSGYLLYAAEVRPTVKARLTDALAKDANLKPADLVRAIAVDWSALGDEGKAKWNTKAKTSVVSDVESEPKPEGVSPGDTITLPSGLVGRVETTNTNGWMTVSVVTANGHNVISVRNYSAKPKAVGVWTHGDNIMFRTLKTNSGMVLWHWQNGTIDKVLDDGWVRVYNDNDSKVNYVLDNITYLKTCTK